MPDSLKSRCQAFLGREIPAELGPRAGSIAETALRLRAGGARLDEEMRELAELAAMDSRATAASFTGEAARYLSDSADLLDEMLAEG